MSLATLFVLQVTLPTFSQYTAYSRGGACYWDPSRADCALCLEGGCQCTSTYQHWCIGCAADVAACSSLAN